MSVRRPRPQPDGGPASAGQRAARAQGGNASNGGSGGASAQTALEAVAEAAREAQTEVGLLAGLLSGEQPPHDQASALQAGPSHPVRSGPGTSGHAGLDLVAGLVQQVQVAGLEVSCRLVSDGDGGDVDTTVTRRVGQRDRRRGTDQRAQARPGGSGHRGHPGRVRRADGHG